ncbi:unnamed protein product [Ambrosiozyma monospora]|uniref:Unnamed protein product n=2 Tax=Ambrosiozyma monospora TaxID=43982 RepID=A0ACB5TE48_AMBMO|nr:unnamed protein product [Ambrosiozyma monospora]
MPFPIVVADGRVPGTLIISGNSTIFEFNAYEMGSWDPSLYSFADLKYIGTNLTNGYPTEDGNCIAGFDNTGYVFGTSSTLFNQFLLQLNTTDLPSVIQDLAHHFLEDVDQDDNDIAEYYPNPFYKTEWASTHGIVEDESLYLCDGGEDKQNIPLAPMLRPEREIDVVFAYDNSYDTNETWPDGASLVNTYERQFTDQGNGTAFPYVPDQNTFVNLNLTAKPTFFGCYGSNLTDLMDQVGTDYMPPLIVYTANRPFTYYSNTSTYKMSYKDEDKLDIIQNGFAVTTRNNLTLDDEFRACVGCAILQRSRERLGMPLGDQCKKCFDEYCWDGSLDSDSSDLPVNYTLEGMTNGAEHTTNSSNESGKGKGKTSGGLSLLYGGKHTSVLGVVVALLAVCLVGF